MKLVSNFLLLAALCPFFAQAGDGKPVLGAMEFGLDGFEVEAFSKEAMSGSGEAARKLSLYYGAEKYDRDLELYWATIGAENGNADCQYIVWFRSRTESDILKQRRAIFWLKRAADQGDAAALDHMSRCVDSSTLLPKKEAGCFGKNAR